MRRADSSSTLHEAAHAVIARHLDVGVVAAGVKIVVEDGFEVTRGYCCLDEHLGPIEPEKLAKIALAARIACRIEDAFTHRWQRTKDTEDAVEAVRQIILAKTDEAVSKRAVRKELVNQIRLTRKLVWQQLDVIRLVASRMREPWRLTGSEIDEIRREAEED